MAVNYFRGECGPLIQKGRHVHILLIGHSEQQVVRPVDNNLTCIQVDERSKVEYKRGQISVLVQSIVRGQVVTIQSVHLLCIVHNTATQRGQMQGSSWSDVKYQIVLMVNIKRNDGVWRLNHIVVENVRGHITDSGLAQRNDLQKTVVGHDLHVIANLVTGDQNKVSAIGGSSIKFAYLEVLHVCVPLCSQSANTSKQVPNNNCVLTCGILIVWKHKTFEQACPLRSSPSWWMSTLAGYTFSRFKATRIWHHQSWSTGLIGGNALPGIVIIILPRKDGRLKTWIFEQKVGENGRLLPVARSGCEQGWHPHSLSTRGSRALISNTMNTPSMANPWEPFQWQNQATIFPSSYPFVRWPLAKTMQLDTTN